MCEAVTITPAAAPRCLIANASTGVGNARGSSIACRPAPVSTAQVSAAKVSERWRAS